MRRPDRDLYFLTIAKAVALRASCSKRQVGCVVVDEHHHILSTGYNGPASGLPICNPCSRNSAQSGQGLDDCVAIHAEQNALLQCPDTEKIHTIYVTASPCLWCVKLMMNTSAKRIVFIDEYPHGQSKDLWERMGREWVHHDLTTTEQGLFIDMTRVFRSMP